MLWLAPAMDVAAKCPPPTPRAEVKSENQFEHVLLLDNSVSMARMKNAFVWEGARAAFRRHAATLPEGDRVSVYVFPGRDETVPKLIFTSSYLDDSDRERLLSRIDGLVANARQSQLYDYWSWLIRNHGQPARGKAFFSYTDGEDSDCDEEILSADCETRRCTKRERQCQEEAREVNRHIQACRPGEAGYCVWTPIMPTGECANDTDCQAGSRCVGGAQVAPRKTGRCVRPPKTDWRAALRPVAGPVLDVNAFQSVPVSLGDLAIRERADFPALIYYQFEPEDGNSLNIEPGYLNLHPGVDEVLPLASRLSWKADLESRPTVVRGRVVVDVCFGNVPDLQPLTVEFTTRPVAVEAERLRLNGTPITKPNLFRLDGTRPQTLVLSLANGGEALGPNVLVGLEGSLSFRSKNAERSLSSVSVVTGDETVELQFSAVPSAWHDGDSHRATLTMRDVGGWFTLDGNKATGVVVLKTNVPGLGYLLALAAIIVVVAVLGVRQLRYPVARGRLELIDSQGMCIALFPRRFGAFSQPRHEVAISSLADGATGVLRLTVGRDGYVTMAAESTTPVTWQEKPVTVRGIRALSLAGSSTNRGPLRIAERDFWVRSKSGGGTK